MTATDNPQVTTGVPFTLNGKAVEAKKDELLIDAADRHGLFGRAGMGGTATTALLLSGVSRQSTEWILEE